MNNSRRAMLTGVTLYAAATMACSTSEIALAEQEAKQLAEILGILTPDGAINWYGLAKGVIEVAALAVPAAAPAIKTALAITDAIVAEIQAGTAAANAHVVLVAKTAALQNQVVTGNVTVIPNS